MWPCRKRTHALVRGGSQGRYSTELARQLERQTGAEGLAETLRGPEVGALIAQGYEYAGVARHGEPVPVFDAYFEYACPAIVARGGGRVLMRRRRAADWPAYPSSGSGSGSGSGSAPVSPAVARRPRWAREHPGAIGEEAPGEGGASDASSSAD